MLAFNRKIYQLPIFTLLFIIISGAVQANNVKNSAVIFMYHKFDISKYPSTNITLSQFEKHLAEFSQPKYNVKSVDYIVDTIINDGQLPNNTVGITVDDADRSFLSTAWPRLKEKGFPVTLFVSTSTIVEVFTNKGTGKFFSLNFGQALVKKDLSASSTLIPMVLFGN